MADTVKHTKGPWFVGSMNDCLFVIDQPPRPSNDDINPEHQTNVVAKLDYRGAEHNALLIAAAPDLLLALQELLEAYSKPDERLCCDGRDCGCMGSTVHQQAEHYARAAIAKSTGGQ
ncbi:hypothetical protein FHW77_002917 [Agrobacterium sp. RC10-4-1]|uniref:hypothetical protein n=1 Tax=Agrobacterium sp. RC10-4-1 TaxID=2587039 RepID=UPI0015FAACCA|nr:hypothetical protein [Agrobacterium sp. RC10-4-1]MBA8799198.1 hypothetical protein [Agrobacterium sp. RC10-4-1]